MKGVPPEVDALMWRLAEEGGPAARAEFESRHTRYAPELERRVRMVAELRQAGKPASHRPTFSPRPIRTKAPRWAWGGVAALAVVAVGAVAYVAASDGERPTPTPSVVSHEVRTEPVVVPAPRVVVQEPAPPKPATSPPPEEPKPVKTPDYRKPRDLRIADTDLTAAIGLVATGSGLNVTVAPGFANQRVSLDYHGLSPVDMLKAMGDQYGFSVVEEEEGHVLVLPAKDASPPQRSVSP